MNNRAPRLSDNSNDGNAWAVLNEKSESSPKLEELVVNDLIKGFEDTRNEITRLKGETKSESKNNIDILKSLEIELERQGLANEDKGKLKAYFLGFVNTFNAAYLCAQAINAGAVQVNSENMSLILSFMGSFSALVRNALKKKVGSVNDFLGTEEVKSKADMLTDLACNAAVLSQIVGNVGLQILQNKKKQKQILETTDQELSTTKGHVFKSLFEFCQKTDEEINVFCYVQLYKNTSERVGHYDANELIKVLTDGKIVIDDVENKFVEYILKPFGEKGYPKKSIQSRTEDRISDAVIEASERKNRETNCCNIF